MLGNWPKIEQEVLKWWLFERKIRGLNFWRRSLGGRDLELEPEVSDQYSPLDLTSNKYFTFTHLTSQKSDVDKDSSHLTLFVRQIKIYENLYRKFYLTSPKERSFLKTKCVQVGKPYMRKVIRKSSDLRKRSDLLTTLYLLTQNESLGPLTRSLRI